MEHKSIPCIFTALLLCCLAISGPAAGKTSKESFFPYKGPAQAISYSPDGHSLAMVDASKGVTVWDVATGRIKHTVTGVAQVSSLALHPNNRWLAFVGEDNKTIKLWDTDTGEALGTFHGHDSEVYAIAFSADGARAASIDRSGTLELWDPRTQREVGTFSLGRISLATFTPDGRLLAVQGMDHEGPGHSAREIIKVWDVANEKLLNTIPSGYSGNGMALSPDGRLLAHRSAHWDKGEQKSVDGVWVYELATGREPRRIPIENVIDYYSVSLAFSPDNRWLAFAQSDASLWDVDSGRQILDLLEDGLQQNVTFSPNGQWLAQAADKGVKLWSVGEPQKLSTGGATMELRRANPNPITRVEFGNDGRTVASQSQGRDPSVYLWDLKTGELTHIVPGRQYHSYASALSPDGQLVAVANRGEAEDSIPYITLWDAHTGEQLRKLEAPEAKEGFMGFVFSPDSRWLALTGFCKIFLLDVATGLQRRTLVVRADPRDDPKIKSQLSDLVALTFYQAELSFSPDGRLLAVTNLYSLQVWDIASGQRLKQLTRTLYEPEKIGDAVFTSDGRWLAALQMVETRTRPWLQWRLVIYDPHTLQPLRSTAPSATTVRLLSGVGSQVITLNQQAGSDNDYRVNVWDAANLKLIRSSRIEVSDSYYPAGFSRDGRWMARVKDQNSIVVSNVETGQVTASLPGIPFRWLESTQKPQEANHEGITKPQQPRPSLP